jgi:hypothetical protein
MAGGGVKVSASLVPKFYLGTPPVPREVLLRANYSRSTLRKIGNEVASASAFPNKIWERDITKLEIYELLFTQ